MNERDLVAALRKKHEGDEWAFFSKVPNSTGQATAIADGLAMNLWPSRGFSLVGYEIKCSRSDWLRELKNPAKAETIAKFCHQWWLVTPKGVDVVAPGELPYNWGHLEWSGKRWKTLSPCKDRLDVIQITPAFAASIVRRAARESATEEELVAAHLDGYKKGKEENEVTSKTRTLEREVSDLREKVNRFEREVGMKLGDVYRVWKEEMPGTLDQKARALKKVLAGEVAGDAAETSTRLLLQRIQETMTEIERSYVRLQKATAD